MIVEFNTARTRHSYKHISAGAKGGPGLGDYIK